MNKIRVMLVDDHTVLRAGMKLLINGQPDMEVIAEADNHTGAMQHAERSHPDVLVLDLSLPGGPSLPIIQKLLSNKLVGHVLVLTMHDDPAYVRAALSSGATGYVVKTIGEQDLLHAIRSVSHGRVVVDLDDEDLTAQVFQSLLNRNAASGSGVAKLSDRETEVLRLLGQGYTNQAIADQLELSPKTVATYRARIAEKLGLKTTADFVKYAVDTGMVGPQS